MKTTNDWKKFYFNKLDNDDVALFLQDYSLFNDDAGVPAKAKRVMASLLCVYENTKATETGVCYMDLNTLKRVSGCNVATLKKYADWLKKNDLLDFKLGSQRSSGVSGQASGFEIKFEHLQNWLPIEASDNVNALHNITEHNTLLYNNSVQHNSENLTEQQNNLKQSSVTQGTKDNNTELQRNSLQSNKELNNVDYSNEIDEILAEYKQDNPIEIQRKIIENFKKGVKANALSEENSEEEEDCLPF